MENSAPTRQLSFNGSGSSLLGIYLVNAILTLITLGFYYPWAKAAILKHLYEETELEGSRFAFHGTGREMFMGFIKAVLIFGVLYGFMIWATLTREAFWIYSGLAVFYLGLLILVPIAIHGSLRYRLSRTSWRGIHFGYRGELQELFKKFATGFLLSIVTLGVYLAWFTIDIRKYVINNIRFGSLQFHYTGTGTDFFFLILKGYFFSIITFGIYLFWFAKDLFNFYVNNILVEQDNKMFSLQSAATGGKYLRLILVNIVIVIFTLGLGTPWAVVRTMRFVCDNILIDGELDLDKVVQTEESYKDATGEDVADMLDISLV